MADDFIALDLETATYDRASICQLGMVKVMDGAIVDEFSSLVHAPEVDPFFTDIHGIDEKALANAPPLEQVLRKAVRFIGNVDTLVTHTVFDLGCLQAAGVRLPGVKWLDTAKVSRRCWLGEKRHGLQAVCQRLGFYDEDGHHNALADARMAARVLLAAFEHSGQGLDYWMTRTNLPITKRINTKGGSFSEIAQEPNADGEHFGATVCFTGALGLKRKEAVAVAARAGFLATATVTEKTDYLVVGVQNSSLVRGGKSSKQHKAEDLCRRGTPVTILAEDEFLALCKMDAAEV